MLVAYNDKNQRPSNAIPVVLKPFNCHTTRRRVLVKCIMRHGPGKLLVHKRKWYFVPDIPVASKKKTTKKRATKKAMKKPAESVVMEIDDG